jgi:U3 small nucleolar RNA-associated protein 7
VPVNRARGKSSSMRRYLRKQTNVLDDHRREVQEKLETEKKEREVARKKASGDYVDKPKTALDRFKI